MALVILACLLGAAVGAHAADWTTWQRQMESAESAWEQDRLVGAEQWLQDAVREAELQDPRSPQLIRSLSILLELYRKQGRSRDVETIAARLKALTPAAAASAGPDLETALQAYATWLKELGRADEAAMVAIRLHRLREVRSAPGRGDFLFFNPVAELRDYAWLLRQRQRESEARAIEALAAAEATKLIDRYENLRKGFAATQGGLPSLTWTQQMTGGGEALEGRLYPEAAALFADAARTAEKFPPNDVRLAYSLSVLAIALRAQGKSSEFTSASQRALVILERAAGQGHSMLPKSLSMLTLAVLRYRFEPAAALAHLERSLRILEKDVPADHPIIGLHLAGLAAVHLALGRSAQALPPLERSLAIAGQQYLPEHAALATGLLTVVDAYANQGDLVRADRVAERVQAILTRLRDRDHPDVLLTTEIRKGLRERMQQPAVAVSLGALTIVPIEVAGNAMLVHATINGTQPALLLIDTGATITALRPLVLRRLGIAIPADAPRRRVTVVSGETLQVPLVLVDLQVGDARVQRMPAAVVEAFPGEADVDGLLGNDFLQRFKLTLDRPARRLSLEPLGQ